MKIKKCIIIFFLIASFGTQAQINTVCYDIKILKNGKDFKERNYMNTFSKNGFFMFENYCYSLIFSDSTKVFGRILKILNDSIYITSSLNQSTAIKRNIDYDTLKYSIKDIKTLQLITEGIDGYTRDIDMSEYHMELVPADCCTDTSKVVYTPRSGPYLKFDTLARIKKFQFTFVHTKSDKGEELTTDCYPYLTNDGVAFIYEAEGLIYVVGSRSNGK